MKVAAAVLAYNAADVIEQMLDSVAAQVDLVVVNLDSKTDDDTRGVIERWAATPYEYEPNLREETPPKPEVRIFDDAGDHAANFGAARNINFAHVWEDSEVEWVMWIDTDDTWGGDVPLREFLAGQPPQVTHIFLPYLYHRNKHGDVDTLFDRERIFRRGGMPRWRYRGHEVCEVLRPIMGARTEQMWIDHTNAEKAKIMESRGDRNFAFLRAMLEDDPNDARAMMYLGHQHFAANQWTQAAEWYEKYLNTPSGDAPVERWQILVWLARARRNEGDVPASIKAASLALQSHPEFSDAYYELAHSYAMRRRWAKAVEFHEMGQTKTERPPAILINSPQDTTANPHRVAHTCYYQLGRYAEALDAVTKALEWDPGDPFLKARGAYYLAAWNRAKAIEAGLLVARHLADTNEPLKARRVLESLPAGAIEERPEIGDAQATVRAMIAHLESDEAYENLYYAEQKETIEPNEEQLAHVKEWYPRMDWVRERLIAARAQDDDLGRPFTALDVGVGNAISSFHFARAGFRVVGIDIDPRRIKDANWNAVKLGFLGLEPRTEEVAVMEGIIADARKKVADERAYYELLLKTENADPEVVAEQERTIERWNERVKVLEAERIEMPEDRPLMAPDAPVQFHVCPIGQITAKVKALGPFDAVVAAEVVEHVEDPASLLEMVETVNGEGKPPRVILTTPDGGWRGPQQRNPSHVQVWSRLEFEALISPRGVIHNSNVIEHPFGEQPNLGIEYVPGVTARTAFIDRPPVSIYCGPGWERWSPEQVDGMGLGGSETAVVHVARALAQRGSRITVFADVEGIWDGVRYRKHSKWRPDIPAWITIAWRHPELFEQPNAANHNWVWAHDTNYGPRVSAAGLRRVDSYLVLSQWHRRHTLEKYPFLDEPFRCGLEHEHTWRCRTEVVVVYNGIDPSRFEGEEERDLNTVAYSSSPDRGLEQALRYWKRVREIRPEATLRIFYGWDNYDLMGGSQSFKRTILALADQPGVVWEGRKGQRALARELMKCSAIFYPGPHLFEETFGITFVEAQAAGCVPVTRDNGALPETNAYGVRVKNDADESEWVRALLEAMSWSAGQRDEMRKWARTVTWGAVADRMVNRALELERLAEADEKARQKAQEPVASPTK